MRYLTEHYLTLTNVLVVTVVLLFVGTIAPLYVAFSHIG